MKHEHILAPFLFRTAKGSAEPDESKLAYAKVVVKDSQTAQEIKKSIAVLKEFLHECPGHEELLVATMALLERQGGNSNMFENWLVLSEMFPDNVLALRMRLRWMRRRKLMEDGLAIAEEWCACRLHNENEALTYMKCLRELKAYQVVDEFHKRTKSTFDNRFKLDIEYIRCLLDRNMFVEAGAVARTLEATDGIGAGSAELIRTAIEFSDAYESIRQIDVGSVPRRMLEAFLERDVPATDASRHGGLILFTGQLGAGGAERQMTRLAVALDCLQKDGREINGRTLEGPVHVAVRHADPASNSDYFRPVVDDNDVPLTVLSELGKPDLANPFQSDGDLSLMFRMLPNDLQASIAKLVPYFKTVKPETVYIWQDGAIRVAALAALAAGVPKIALCFRSSPINIRKDRYRSGFDGYFETLARIPGVTLACNSSATAGETAEWLDVPLERIKVIHNAVTPPMEIGNSWDADAWKGIENASPECTKTVLGVFRYDPVKRAAQWVELAARYLEKDPLTRFVIIGAGVDRDDIEAMIQKLGLRARIFTPGHSTAVDFWLSKADVVLHTSRHEGLPNAIVEAQLAGCPVVVTPAGGTPEALIHGESGICLSANDPFPIDEALDALSLLLNDCDLRERMEHAAIRHAMQEFSLEKTLSNTMALLCGSADARDES